MSYYTWFEISNLQMLLQLRQWFLGLTPWEYPSVPTVDVFRTGCKNLLYQVKSSTET